MREPMPPTVPRVFVDDVPGAFIGFGADADLDAAFDDALTTAWYEVGHAGLVPSVADAESTDVTVIEDAPRRPLGASLLVARAALDEMEPGSVRAIPVAADRFYRRRKLRVRLEDVEIHLPDEPGLVVAPDEAILGALSGAGEDAGAPVSEAELLERLELAAVRRRFKPLVTVNRGPSARHFALDLDGRDLPGGHRTASEARRAAVALAKAGPYDDVACYTLSVTGRTGREGDLPLISIERRLVAQRARLVATYATEKDPLKTKTSGWIFYGRRPA